MSRTIVLSVILVTVGVGRTILVPDSVATIQAGLNIARYGDTVLVRPGTYNENLVWPSVDGIKLISEAGPASTIVDGNGAGACLVMNTTTLTRATEVRGFTFQKGAATGGGGIICAGGVTIAGNRVTRCRGTGVYLSSYLAGFSPLVIANEIDGCVKEEQWSYGGGMYVDAPVGARPEICYNYIHDDTCRNGPWNYGGGIYCDAEALIYQNVIARNVLTSDTSSSCRAYGAGIFVDMGRRPLIFANLIVGNRCETDAWKYGAGIRLDIDAKPVIIGNTIAGNVCTGPHMWSNGGGIYSDMRCTSYVKNNIITGNQATSGSGIYNYTSTQNGLVVSLYNNYYNNTLVGCSMGPGDITSNPLFVSGPRGGYYLSQTAAGQPQTSPCVDAGDTLEPAAGLNLDSLLRSWTTRTDSVYDVGRLDMGYHYPYSIGLALAEGSLLVPATGRIIPTVIGQQLWLNDDQGDSLQMELIDATGRRVMRLRSGQNEMGRLSPGVYFAVGRSVSLRLVKF